MEIRRVCSLGFATFFVASVLGCGSAWAKDPPSDLCSLLTPAQLEKALGQPFGDPSKGKWPAPYPGQPEGTKCEYWSQKGSTHVTFIAYVDASAAQAKENFDKLSMWFPAKSKPSIGDSAYIDTKDAIHVLKGRIRYFISFSPFNNREKNLTDLATQVAAEI